MKFPAGSPDSQPNKTSLTLWKQVVESKFCFALAFSFLVFTSNALVSGQESGDSKSNIDAKYFTEKVKPILKKRCFSCHGDPEVKGEYVLTNREDMIAGGESGEAVDFDDVQGSVLLEALRYEGYEMPPEGELPKEELEVLTKWIQAKMPWDDSGFKPKAEAHGKKIPEVNEETKKFWSFQPVRKPSIPDVSSEKTNNNWNQNPIDRFLLEGLKKQGLAPNPKATRGELIRRVYYDLIGLPPTPRQVKEFVADDDPKAYEKIVDRLLQSKHYGEKWGRHWLDLVRYGESNSYERDGTKPFVWKYRDYVIRSFNSDKPYDLFLKEQLAGDEMIPRTKDRIIATGYYRLGIWDDEPADPKQAWYDDMDDVIGTTSKSMLGLTIDCARCHDHKIDPIPQEDYYRFLAFFRNVKRYGVRSHQSVLKSSTTSIAPLLLLTKHENEVRNYNRQVQENLKALKKIEDKVKPDFIPVEHEEFKHEMNRVPLVKKRVESGKIEKEEAENYSVLFAEMKRLRREKPKALEQALCVKESGVKPQETFVMIRGNANSPGDNVEPGFPAVLSPPEPSIIPSKATESTGRRTALANWIASKSNPLTARVMVNRIWQHHFGRGIVRSTSDFGFQGRKPTHPALLDWLASDFVDGGWKIKRMHRQMMLSQAYQMSSRSRKDAYGRDPLNDHFWRFNPRRLSAEEIRDSILAVIGKINLEKMYGPSIYPVIPKEVLQGQSRPGENWGRSSEADRNRRSIYIHIKRSLPVPMLANFDIADPDSPCPVRFNTVQPTQALTMINSDFINRKAKVFAEDLARNHPKNLSAQVAEGLRRVLQREPTRIEVSKGVDLIEALNKELPNRDGLKHFCLVALNLNEFLFLD